MLRKLSAERLDRSEISQAPPSSWTEEDVVVENLALYSEETSGGKISFSCRLELVGDPESSRNTRNRKEIQLVFGLEEKEITTFARLLGRKAMIILQRPVSQLQLEELEQENFQLRQALAESERKVSYLNDSLHHYVQESRNFISQ